MFDFFFEKKKLIKTKVTTFLNKINYLTIEIAQFIETLIYFYSIFSNTTKYQRRIISYKYDQ